MFGLSHSPSPSHFIPLADKRVPLAATAHRHDITLSAQFIVQKHRFHSRPGPTARSRGGLEYDDVRGSPGL